MDAGEVRIQTGWGGPDARGAGPHARRGKRRRGTAGAAASH